MLKSRDITLPTKVHLVKAMVFSVVMYGCDHCNIQLFWGKYKLSILCSIILRSILILVKLCFNFCFRNVSLYSYILANFKKWPELPAFSLPFCHRDKWKKMTSNSLCHSYTYRNEYPKTIIWVLLTCKVLFSSSNHLQCAQSEPLPLVYMSSNCQD